VHVVLSPLSCTCTNHIYIGNGHQCSGCVSQHWRYSDSICPISKQYLCADKHSCCMRVQFVLVYVHDVNVALRGHPWPETYGYAVPE